MTLQAILRAILMAILVAILRAILKDDPGGDPKGAPESALKGASKGAPEGDLEGDPGCHAEDDLEGHSKDDPCEWRSLVTITTKTWIATEECHGDPTGNSGGDPGEGSKGPL